MKKFMKKFVLLALLIYFIFINASALNADFYWYPSNPTDIELINFYDNSTGDIIAWIWYFGDGNSSTEKNPVHKYADDGTYTVRLVVWDSNGSISHIEKNITVLNVPPFAIAKNISSNNYTVVFNGSLSYDLDGYITNYKWNFGDGKYAYGKIVTHKYDDEGIYMANLTVYDDDGDYGIANISVLIDVTPPKTNYSLNKKMEWYNEKVAVELKATDNLAGINATFYKINEGKWHLYKRIFNVSNEGINIIRFYSVDKVGNVEEEKSIIIKIDYSPPETKYLVNAKYGKDGWIKGTAKIKLIANDSLSGVSYTMYKIDDGEWKYYGGDFSLSTNGIHIIRFYSVDKVGNVEEEKNFTIKIDNKKPSLNIKTLMEGYVYIAGRKIIATLFGKTIIIGKFTLEVEANDKLSGIDYVEFRLNDEILWKDYFSPYNVELPQELFASNKLKIIAYDRAGNYVESNLIRYIKIL